MPRWLKYGILFTAFLLLASLPLARQSEPGSPGSVEGSITCAKGPVADASVQARNLMSGAEFNVKSNAAGHYEILNLEPERYSLWVEAPGHDSVWIPEIAVEHGQTTRRDIRLEWSRKRPTS